MVRVHGLTLIRDEWPLALLSINHALLHHVDRLTCAVQSSADATLEGVQRLQEHWGDRLTVLEVRTPAYLQEAIVTVLARQVARDAADDDWLHVFDADEFAVTPAGIPLPQLLDGVPPDGSDLRYRVWNWIAPADFDDLDLDGYGRLRHRALPCVFLNLPHAEVAAEIGRGFLNYFDLPFLDKSLFRIGALRDRWIGPGAHRLRPPPLRWQPPTELPEQSFHVIHLPLLSRRRLGTRLEQARNLLAQGFPFQHGWQSRMLLDLEARGELEAFWQRHSIGGGCPPDASATPHCEESDLFAAAIAPALALTTSLLERPTAPLPPPPPLSEELCLRAIHQLQRQLADLHRDLRVRGVNAVASEFLGPGSAPGPTAADR